MYPLGSFFVVNSSLLSIHRQFQLEPAVSRRVDPIESAVLTIGVFQAGTAFNVIADKAKIEGTVRTFNKEVRKEVETEIRSIVKGLSEAYHAGYEINYLNGYPSLVNAEVETERVRELVSRLYGADAFLDLKLVMGAEDFAHHHPHFDFDERALLVSGHIFLALALEYLQ
ncbi:peptidase dimerization domain-containing protein [Paenibacillus sp. TY11]|uniref:peptidase dimerization domain-containing protein n=1 Tax=Paenibacillus sp. TY11 TaxID=3448633 RepID=UPI00403A716E